MEIIMDGIAGGLSGSTNNSNVTTYPRLGRTVAQAKVRPENLRTPGQVVVRSVCRPVMNAWRELTPEQQETWNTFALRLYPPGGKQKTGFQVFSHAAFFQAHREMEIRPAPPSNPEPPPVTRVALAPSAEKSTLALTVEHCLGDQPGVYMMTVKSTPPSRVRGGSVNRRNAQLICRVRAQSTVALPPSGSTVVFADLWRSVPPGHCVGIEIVLSRVDDAYPGPAVFCRLKRMD